MSQMETDQPGRRRHARFELSPRVPVRVGEAGTPGYAHNLSLGGAFVVAKRLEVEMQAEVDVRLELPAPLEPVTARAKVVHLTPGMSNGGRSGFGLSFVAIDEAGSQRLADFLQVPVGATEEREPKLCHPLPPIRDFQGRHRELQQLTEWVADLDIGVIAIVGQGGAGKTALLERLIHQGVGEQCRGGLFFWSFYNDTDVDHFLAEALAYFGVDATDLHGLGRVYALERALSETDLAMLALDGLERVQDDEENTRGRVTDAALRLLLQRLGRRTGTTTAVVTSRFPLAGITERGVRSLELERLDPEASAALLAATGVGGEQGAREEIAEHFGGHALTLSVLGSLLSTYHKGDPAAVTHLGDAGSIAAASQSARLGLVLDAFATALPPAETAILERLAAFRAGSTAEVLDDVFLKRKAQAGITQVFERLRDPLRKMERATLEAALQRLSELRLLHYDAHTGVYTFHAAIKDHFYVRLVDGGARDKVHEQVREHLSERPLKPRPVNHETLAVMEELIHHTLGAGRLEDAFKVYWDRLDGYNHLGRTLGDYNRGLRLCDAFFRDGVPHRPRSGLDAWHAAMLAGDAGLYLEKLGEIERAYACHNVGIDAARRERDWANASVGFRNQAKLRLLQGRLPDARRLADQALATARNGADERGIYEATFLIAAADGYLGRSGQAGAAFAEAERTMRSIEGGAGGLVDLGGSLYADHLRRTGDLNRAVRVASGCLQWARHKKRGQSIARAQLDLAHIALDDQDMATAQQQLQMAEEFAFRSGWQEALCRVGLLWAKVQLTLGDLADCERQLTEAIELASGAGYGLLHLDLLVVRAEARLKSDPSAAASIAEVVAKHAGQDTLGHQWAEVGACVVRGQALGALGRKDEARTVLVDAHGKQLRALDPRAEQTQALIDGL